MAEHNVMGQKGEELAVAYLKENGFEILETNWRLGQLEVDIIAKKGEYLVIVEVKSRSTNLFGEPEVFVDKKKQSLLIRAANGYVDRYNIDLEIRFDIVTVISNNGRTAVNHIESAFYPVVKRTY